MDRKKVWLVSNVFSYPDKVSQCESVLLLYDGASVMDAVQQGTHQFTCKSRNTFDFTLITQSYSLEEQVLVYLSTGRGPGDTGLLGIR